MNDYEPSARPRRQNPRPSYGPNPPPRRRRRPPTRRRKQTPWLPAVSLLLFLVVLAGGGFLVLRHLQNNTDYIPVGTSPIQGSADPATGGLSHENTSPDSPTADNGLNGDAQSDPPNLYAQGIPLVSMPLSAITDTRYLELVNRHYGKNGPLDDGYIVSAWSTVPVRATDITIHRSALAAVESLFNAGRHVTEYFVTSAYRSVARQAEIYNNAADRSYVMPPGHSEHNLGLGIDILAPGIPMNSAQMSGTPEANWLAENSWRHGLILRYPAHAIEITEVSYEPWHFRYVGLVHAWYITNNNMVLEEYLEYLAASGGFTAVVDGVTYYVIYHHEENGRLYVPRDLPFTVSASNRGGYVITAWE